MTEDQGRRKAVVVGAGPGGLAAAMLLAGQGYEVQVYEKQPFIGGRSSRVELGDYRFDRGATFLMMPELLEELFEQVGRSVHDYVQMKELDPLYSLHFGDKVFSPSSKDHERTAEMIEELFPGNGEGYRRFLRDEKVKFERVMPLLRRPFGKLGDYMRRDVFRALPKLHANDTVYGRLSKYFTDERLRWAFTFQAKYLGMSAWECPGTFTILSYIEHRYGLLHPVGGINRVFEAMADVVREYGGQIHTGSPVRQVLTRNGRAEGLELANGEKVYADHVVINADFTSAVTSLFKPGTLRKYTPEAMQKKKYSCSTTMLYLGVDGSIDLPHHSIHFPADYRLNVDEITKYKRLSDDPSIYIHNPSVIDPTLAPPGKSALYVLMPTPNLDADIDWEREGEAVKEKLLSRLEQLPALHDLRSRIEQSMFYSPLDWERDLNVHKGATFNLAHNLGQMMYLRPHNQFEEMKGVWLVGGGTHPGSGLPTIFESARISVQLLQEEDQRLTNRRIPVPQTAGAGRP
ncbi:phytoene desaturase family protein [Paenibacillus sp. JX-17]|uniref:Phytoene desaturase family protein n=1 Tax=Paenibacillus lacisoli TaxID=3064525 RepID=A0ABT9CB53_9BACL|nr:phytoene desaturase family protein [Paenibacillus sp. JX-17]MDO7906494.1 phytoene desaturase family protein [Paenibacillus sp. JX-17]